MLTRAFSIAVLSAASIVLAITAAAAAPKKRGPNEPSNTPMTACMTEVGARWDAYGRRWWFTGGAGNPQEQAYYDCLDRIANRSMTRTSTPAQQTRSQPSNTAKATFVPAVQENHQRSVFSGNESRSAAMNNVKMDCSSGPRPHVRIVTPPSNGAIHLRPIRYVVDRGMGNPRSHCNGKTVNAVGVFYRSKAKHAGADSVVLEVDFKQGRVNRYTYAIQVR